MAPRTPPTPSRLVRSARFLRRHWVLSLLIALDLITKVAAFHLLPLGEPVLVLPGLRFLLAVNEWGVMGGANGMSAVAANSVYTMCLAVGLLVFSRVVYGLGRSSLAFGWRLLAGFFAFAMVALLAELVSAPLADVQVATSVVVASIRFALVVMSVAFYAASRAPWPRAAFLLLAGGSLSNAASYLYPPYNVVDFLVVPLQPLMERLGDAPAVAAAGPASGMVGVINLADLYLFAFPFVVLAWPLFATMRVAKGWVAR